MKLIRIVILAVAAVAAIGAAFMARGLLSDGPKQAVAKKTQLEVVDVLVAARNIELGSLVVDKDLQWQKWPKKVISPGFLIRGENGDKRKKVEGAAVRATIVAGEPINMTKLVTVDSGGFMAAVLPKGMLAISVRISPQTGAGGFILPNDRVDVLLTHKQKSSDRQRKEVHLSETILTNVRILAIDQSLKEKNGKEGGGQVAVGKTATLELRSKQAELLSLAVSQGEITLALRSLRDNKTDGAGPQTTAYMGKKKNSGRSASEIKVLRYGLATVENSKQ